MNFDSKGLIHLWHRVKLRTPSWRWMDPPRSPRFFSANFASALNLNFSTEIVPTLTCSTYCRAVIRVGHYSMYILSCTVCWSYQYTMSQYLGTTAWHGTCTSTHRLVCTVHSVTVQHTYHKLQPSVPNFSEPDWSPASQRWLNIERFNVLRQADDNIVLTSPRITNIDHSID